MSYPITGCVRVDTVSTLLVPYTEPVETIKVILRTNDPYSTPSTSTTRVVVPIDPFGTEWMEVEDEGPVDERPLSLSLSPYGVPLEWTDLRPNSS